MLVFASIVFFISLCGIVALFAVKYWEDRRKLELATFLRSKADEQAFQIKILLAKSKVEAAKLPPRIIHFLRSAVHVAALGTARFARMLEKQSHRLADFVSHKHHFERGESKSEYLKQVSEHALKNRDGSNHISNKGLNGHRDEKDSIKL